MVTLPEDLSAPTQTQGLEGGSQYSLQPLNGAAGLYPKVNKWHGDD